MLAHILLTLNRLQANVRVRYSRVLQAAHNTLAIINRFEAELSANITADAHSRAYTHTRTLLTLNHFQANVRVRYSRVLQAAHTRAIKDRLEAELSANTTSDTAVSSQLEIAYKKAIAADQFVRGVVYSKLLPQLYR